MHHVIILGYANCGKSACAQHLSSEYKKHVMELDECVDFCIEKKTQGGILAENYLSEKQNELENIMNERERLKKKAGKKSAELESKWGAINEG